MRIIIIWSSEAVSRLNGFVHFDKISDEKIISEPKRIENIQLSFETRYHNTLIMRKNLMMSPMKWDGFSFFDTLSFPSFLQ